MGSGGRSELLFSVQGADLDATEQCFQPLLLHTTQKIIFRTVHCTGVGDFCRKAASGLVGEDHWPGGCQPHLLAP